MAVIKIYGVRSAYDPEVKRWYKYRPDAQKAVDESNKKYPELEYRITPAYYDDGEN